MRGTDGEMIPDGLYMVGPIALRPPLPGELPPSLDGGMFFVTKHPDSGEPIAVGYAPRDVLEPMADLLRRQARGHGTITTRG